MKSKEAFLDTLNVIKKRNRLEILGEDKNDPCSITHFEDMYSRMTTEDFSEGKTNRWLGYIQGVAVALNILSLEDCKDINRNRSED